MTYYRVIHIGTGEVRACLADVRHAFAVADTLSKDEGQTYEVVVDAVIYVAVPPLPPPLIGGDFGGAS